MFSRLLVAIICAAAIGIGLLALRQQRLEMMHEMTRLHSEMDVIRRDIWEKQVKIAEKTDPQSLKEASARANLVLEPATPSPTSATENNMRVVSGE
ncbi:hypothetical protein [Poriferisphaera sp. WC338]|uniref:hypothetical protein n=1 Tax=Poriferisphaera sp. WC338 TaxID=3425129 RepID=UPI003D812F93